MFSMLLFHPQAPWIFSLTHPNLQLAWSQVDVVVALQVIVIDLILTRSSWEKGVQTAVKQRRNNKKAEHTWGSGALKGTIHHCFDPVHDENL